MFATTVASVGMFVLGGLVGQSRWVPVLCRSLLTVQHSRTLQKLPIWAQIWVSSDCKTPWLDSQQAILPPLMIPLP